MIEFKPSSGDRIGNLVLKEMVGRGGFGEVWRAVPLYGESRSVAVKFARLPRYSRFLRREGRILSLLNHPRIVRILDMNPDSNPPYLVREFVEGESLRALLSRGTPALHRVYHLIHQILEALEYAHSMGVVHGDLKPENIIVDPMGKAKLTDFGIGRFMEAESSSLIDSLPKSSSKRLGLAGTLNYMSPEQKQPGKRVDARSDIFSFGLVFFELLTGEIPQGGEGPTELRPNLPHEMDKFFFKCYTRIGKRFPSARKAREALESFAPLFGGRKASARSERGLEADPSFHERETIHLSAALPLQRTPVIEGGGGGGCLPRRLSAAGGARRRHGVARTATALVSAGFCSRSIAFLIDLMILYILQYFIFIPRIFIPIKMLHAWPFFPFSHMCGGLLSPYYSFGAWFSSLSMNLPLFAGYFILTTWLWGRTVGKLVMGLKVVRDDGGDVGLLEAVLRAAGYYLNILTQGIGFLIMIFTPRSKGLHDYLSQTRVVEE